MKFSAAPAPARGFWSALEDLDVRAAAVVAPVRGRYAGRRGVTVLPPAEIGDFLREAGSGERL